MSDHEQYFNTRFAEDARRVQMWSHLSRYLSAYVPPGAAVLELGAGYCYFINAVKARRRVAVDLSETVARAAAPGVEAIVGGETILVGRLKICPETMRLRELQHIANDMQVGLGEHGDRRGRDAQRSRLLQHLHHARIRTRLPADKIVNRLRAIERDDEHVEHTLKLRQAPLEKPRIRVERREEPSGFRMRDDRHRVATQQRLTSTEARS